MNFIRWCYKHVTDTLGGFDEGMTHLMINEKNETYVRMNCS